MIFCVKSSGIYLPNIEVFINKGLFIKNEPRTQDIILPISKFFFCKGSFLVPYSFGLSRMLNFFNNQLSNFFLSLMWGFRRSLSITGMGYKFNVTENLVTVKAKNTKQSCFIKSENLDLYLSEKDRKLYIYSNRPVLLIRFSNKLRTLQKVDPYTLKGLFYSFESFKKKVGKKPLY